MYEIQLIERGPDDGVQAPPVRVLGALRDPELCRIIREKIILRRELELQRLRGGDHDHAA